MYWNPAVERLSVEELKQLQGKRLRQTVDFAYNYSPFYRKLYNNAGIKPDDIKSAEDVIKLPFREETGFEG